MTEDMPDTDGLLGGAMAAVYIMLACYSALFAIVGGVALWARGQLDPSTHTA